MKSHRIEFDDEDLDFIREYKEAGFAKSIQAFAREAIKAKIKHIQAQEIVDNLELIKTHK